MSGRKCVPKRPARLWGIRLWIFPYLNHNYCGNIALRIPKRRCFGKIPSNNLAESSFSGVTAQVQCYGRIDRCSAAYFSDTARNRFVDRPTTKNQMEGHQQVFFHGLPDELQITLVMFAMEDAPENWQSNNNDMNWQRTMRHMKVELTWEKGFKHTEDEFI